MAVPIKGKFREYIQDRIKLDYELRHSKYYEAHGGFPVRVLKELIIEIMDWGYTHDQAERIVGWFEDDFWGLNDPDFEN